MEYKIVWIEWTERTDKELKEFMKTLPNPKITGGDCNGMTEIECFDTFESNTIEEAKQVIDTDFDAVETFILLDDTGKRVMTDEDLE